MEEDEEEDGSGGLAYGQYVTLNVLTITAATLSIVGSSSILAINVAAYHQQQKRLGSYERLVVSLSCCDIFFSSLFVLQIFFIPSTKEYAFWAIGNEASCNIMGFLGILFSTLVITYSASLSLYFLTTIKYGWPAAKVVARVERPVHIWAWGFALGLSILGLATDQYDVLPLSQACYFSDYEYPAMLPASSFVLDDGNNYTNSTTNTTNNTATFTETDEEEMIVLTSTEREFIPTALNTFHVLYWSLSAVSGVVMTYVVSRHVKYQLNMTRHTRMSTRLSFRNVTSTTITGIADGNIRNGSNSNGSNNNPPSLVDAQIMNVTWQAIWYCAAYTNSFFWPVVRLIAYEVEGSGSQGNPLHFVLAMLHHFFYPLQGAFNFVVFVRPSILQWKKYFPRQSMGWILKQIFRGEKAVQAAEAAGAFRQRPRRARQEDLNPDNHMDIEEDGDETKEASRNFGLLPSSNGSPPNTSTDIAALERASVHDEGKNDKEKDASAQSTTEQLRTSQTSHMVSASGQIIMASDELPISREAPPF